MKRREAEPRLDDILRLHRGGKTRRVSRLKLETIEQLRQVYTPGVARVSKMIEADPALAYDYTSIGDTVAVITNGTAVLGLGDIGVLGAMPVMEGKSVIFMEMVDIAAVPLLFEFKRAGLSSTGKVLGAFVPTGIRSAYTTQLEQAGFKFDAKMFARAEK